MITPAKRAHKRRLLRQSQHDLTALTLKKLAKLGYIPVKSDTLTVTFTNKYGLFYKINRTSVVNLLHSEPRIVYSADNIAVLCSKVGGRYVEHTDTMVIYARNDLLYKANYRKLHAYVRGGLLPTISKLSAESWPVAERIRLLESRGIFIHDDVFGDKQVENMLVLTMPCGHIQQRCGFRIEPYNCQVCARNEVLSRETDDTIYRCCTKCGKEAHTEEELELFIRRKYAKHNRANHCKECSSNRQKAIRVARNNLLEVRYRNARMVDRARYLQRKRLKMIKIYLKLFT